MAVTKFEVGKYYRWTGSKEGLTNWSEPMDAMLDGKPRKALSVDLGRVSFEGLPGQAHFGGWYWGHVLDRISEVTVIDTTEVIITASMAKELVRSGTPCEFYDESLSGWIACTEYCAYQDQYRYRKTPRTTTRMPWLSGLKGEIITIPHVIVRKKSIKERRRDIRKRMLGI